jgi:hypothetical protein
MDDRRRVVLALGASVPLTSGCLGLVERATNETRNRTGVTHTVSVYPIETENDREETVSLSPSELTDEAREFFAAVVVEESISIHTVSSSTLRPGFRKLVDSVCEKLDETPCANGRVGPTEVNLEYDGRLYSFLYSVSGVGV